MSKWCAHIASTKSSEGLKSWNKGSESDIQSERSVLNSLAYVQQVSDFGRETFDSPKYWSNSTIGMHRDHNTSQKNLIKKWSI